MKIHVNVSERECKSFFGNYFKPPSLCSVDGQKPLCKGPEPLKCKNFYLRICLNMDFGPVLMPFGINLKKAVKFN